MPYEVGVFLHNISALSYPPLMVFIFFWCLFYLIAKKKIINFFVLLLSVLSFPYSSFLKGLFKLERPQGFLFKMDIPVKFLEKYEIYSFPSTHTVFYTAFFGYLFYLSYKIKNIDKMLRHFVRIFCFIVILFVGVSRIYLNAHYLRDVIGGYFFGFLYLAFMINFEKFLEQKSTSKRLKRKKP